MVTHPINCTLSGRIGKVVASHAVVARSIPLRCTDLYYARGGQEQGIYINRYTYQSCWNVFLRGSAGGGEQPTDLSEFQRFLICNDV